MGGDLPLNQHCQANVSKYSHFIALACTTVETWLVNGQETINRFLVMQLKILWDLGRAAKKPSLLNQHF